MKARHTSLEKVYPSRSAVIADDRMFGLIHTPISNDINHEFFSIQKWLAGHHLVPIVTISL